MTWTTDDVHQRAYDLGKQYAHAQPNTPEWAAFGTALNGLSYNAFIQGLSEQQAAKVWQWAEEGGEDRRRCWLD